MANVLIVVVPGTAGPFQAFDLTNGFQAAAGTLDAVLQRIARQELPATLDTPVAPARIPAIYTAIFAALTTAYTVGATEYRDDGTVAMSVKIYYGQV